MIRFLLGAPGSCLGQLLKKTSATESAPAKQFQHAAFVIVLMSWSCLSRRGFHAPMHPWVNPACDSVFFSSTWRQAFLHISPFRHHIPRGSAWITLRASLAGPTGFSRQRSLPSYWHAENAHDTGASLICGACVHVCVCLRAYTYIHTYIHYIDTHTYTYTYTYT